MVVKFVYRWVVLLLRQLRVISVARCLLTRFFLTEFYLIVVELTMFCYLYFQPTRMGADGYCFQRKIKTLHNAESRLHVVFTYRV